MRSRGVLCFILATCGMFLPLADLNAGRDAQFEPVENRHLSFTHPWIHLKDAEAAPVVVFRVAPKYPFEARRAGLQGAVRVAFLINAEGVPEELQIHSATARVFCAPALAAVAKWRFKPARKDGAVVRVVVSEVISFRLGE